MYEVMHHKRHI